MQIVEVFEHDDFARVRVIELEGQPWFALKDVCETTYIAPVNRLVVDYLRDDQKVLETVGTATEHQRLWFVSESGLYALIYNSGKVGIASLPSPLPFLAWICGELGKRRRFSLGVRDEGRGTSELTPSASGHPSQVGNSHNPHSHDVCISQGIETQEGAIPLIEGEVAKSSISSAKRRDVLARIKRLEKFVQSVLPYDIDTEMERREVVASEILAPHQTLSMAGLKDFIREWFPHLGVYESIGILRDAGLLYQDYKKKYHPTVDAINQFLFISKMEKHQIPCGQWVYSRRSYVTQKGLERIIGIFKGLGTRDEQIAMSDEL